jgi:hypothetical protein
MQLYAGQPETAKRAYKLQEKQKGLRAVIELPEGSSPRPPVFSLRSACREETSEGWIPQKASHRASWGILPQTPVFSLRSRVETKRLRDGSLRSPVIELPGGSSPRPPFSRFARRIEKKRLRDGSLRRPVIEFHEESSPQTPVYSLRSACGEGTSDRMNPSEDQSSNFLVRDFLRKPVIKILPGNAILSFRSACENTSAKEFQRSVRGVPGVRPRKTGSVH